MILVEHHFYRRKVQTNSAGTRPVRRYLERRLSLEVAARLIARARSDLGLTYDFRSLAGAIFPLALIGRKPRTIYRSVQFDSKILTSRHGPGLQVAFIALFYTEPSDSWPHQIGVGVIPASQVKALDRHGRPLIHFSWCSNGPPF